MLIVVSCYSSTAHYSLCLQHSHLIYAFGFPQECLAFLRHNWEMAYYRYMEQKTLSLLLYHLGLVVILCNALPLNEKSKSLWHFIQRANLHEEFFKIFVKIMNNIGFLSMSCFWEDSTTSDDHLSKGCLYCRDQQTYHNFWIWTLDLNIHRHKDHIEESYRKMGFIELEVNEILCCLVLNISAGLVCLVLFTFWYSAAAWPWLVLHFLYYWKH